jgi:ATP-binding cassette subfamily F protein 3
MVPMIRNILGGFLFSGDDIHKRARVLSGGERTRLAVARMLLRPANTLLLDEPTNHLDLESKDVLLEALADFGGTLIFVSHDRYFVDRLATKIVAIGEGRIEVYPGTYDQFLWSRTQRTGNTAGADAAPGPAGTSPRPNRPMKPRTPRVSNRSYEEKKRADADARRQRRAVQTRAKRVADLEGRIAAQEQAIKELEQQMAEPGFYERRDKAQAVIARHQALMWKVGDLMNQWEAIQTSKVAD